MCQSLQISLGPMQCKGTVGAGQAAVVQTVIEAVTLLASTACVWNTTSAVRQGGFLSGGHMWEMHTMSLRRGLLPLERDLVF